MKFLVPNYSCLQNPWLGGYCPQIPVLFVLCSQLNLLYPSPPPNKIPGYATVYHVSSPTGPRGIQQRTTNFENGTFFEVCLGCGICSAQLIDLIYFVLFGNRIFVCKLRGWHKSQSCFYNTNMRCWIDSHRLRTFISYFHKRLQNNTTRVLVRRENSKIE